MRAAVCHRFGSPLSVEEVHLGEPAAGEVTVRVRACGVCHSDITFMDGLWGGELPAVYGHEVAGTVTSTGEGVDGLRAGDHVVVTLVRECGECFFCRRGEPTQCEGRFAIDERPVLTRDGGVRLKQGLRVGGFAECVTVHASQVIPIPASIPLESACLLSCAVATGVGAVRNTAAVMPGVSVVIVGAGGVGINSVQAARIAGATPVIAIDVSDARLSAARDAGATHAVNPTSDDAISAVKTMTGGRGADYTFITSGSPAAMALGLQLPRRGGTVVIVGMTGNGETVAIDPGDVADKALRILGCKLGAIRPHADIPALVELYSAGKLRLDELVTSKHSLDDINQGIASARSGMGVRSVIVM